MILPLSDSSPFGPLTLLTVLISILSNTFARIDEVSVHLTYPFHVPLIYSILFLECNPGGMSRTKVGRARLSGFRSICSSSQLRQLKGELTLLLSRSHIESFSVRVKTDALFMYQPPFNLFAYVILLPLSWVLSPRALHTVNVFLIRLTVGIIRRV